MINFFNLCINENIKLYKKALTIVFIILLFLSLIISTFVIYYIKDSNIIKEELYKSTSYETTLIDITEKSFKAFEKIEGATSSLDSEIKYYKYAIDNNISLDSFSQNNNHYKYIILQDLIKFDSELNNIKDNNSHSIQKKIEIELKIEYLKSILENDDFISYINYKIQDIETLYKNNTISENNRNLRIYIENLNLKYEIGKYDNISEIWKDKAIKIIENNKNMLLNGKDTLSNEEKEKLNNSILLQLNNLDNNIPINDGLINVVNYNDAYIDLVEIISMSLLTLFIIIASALCMAGEFSKGTIKQTFMTPNKRWKILLSKILVMVINLIFFTIILSLLSQLFGNLFFGENLRSSYSYIVNNQINIIDSFSYTLLKFLSHDIEIIVYILFTFMTATISKDTSMSVGISTFIYMGNILFMRVINKEIIKEWVKFIPFNNLNFTNKIFSNSTSILTDFFPRIENFFVDNITLNFSINITFVYTFILIVITFISFNKRNFI